MEFNSRTRYIIQHHLRNTNKSEHAPVCLKSGENLDLKYNYRVFEIQYCLINKQETGLAFPLDNRFSVYLFSDFAPVSILKGQHTNS